MEYHRLRDWRAARLVPLTALGAVGLGILVELGAALLAAATWLGAVLFLDAAG